MTTEQMIEKLAEAARAIVGEYGPPAHYDEPYRGMWQALDDAIAVVDVAALRAPPTPAPPADLVALVQRAQAAIADHARTTLKDRRAAKLRADDAIAAILGWTPAAPVGEPLEFAGMVATAVRQASYSPCRSQRGVVIYHGHEVLSTGFNRKPVGFECDGSAACKATCRVEAIHAEQDALIAARRSVVGADLIHVKSVDGALVPSGGPSCVACSKLIVEAGIAGVWLFHVDGWQRYEAASFHRLSLAALSSPVGETPARKCPGCAGRGVVGGYEPIEFGNTLSAHPVDVPCPDCNQSSETPEAK